MKNKKINIMIILIFTSILSYSAPFFGGYFSTSNQFDNNVFTTIDYASFYLDHNINQNIEFYTRITAGVQFNADYNLTEAQLSDLYVILNIDLLYFKFKMDRQHSPVLLKSKYHKGETNFDLFSIRFGRIHISHLDNFVFSHKADGFETSFSLSNLKISLFGVTNALDYSSFFNFAGTTSNITFTRWDKMRIPSISHFHKENNTDGFISDINNSDYNYAFYTDDETDYTKNEKQKLNNIRTFSVLAGRIFTGFSVNIYEIYFQNFGIGFLANIDLIPQEFILTYPSNVYQIRNTFGGKYTSMYISGFAHGKIYKGLYYNASITYETGFNATYTNSGTKGYVNNELINSFAFSSGFSYYFNSITKPFIAFDVNYAHGDEDAVLNDNIVLNKTGEDNTYKTPTQNNIGYVIKPDFSNLLTFGLQFGIQPFSHFNNPFISNLFLKSEIIIFNRPVIKGDSFLNEKMTYQRRPENYIAFDDDLLGTKFENYEKFFLGAEMNFSILWPIFSDLNLELNGGFFIPNYIIMEGDDFPWKIGLSVNFSI